MWGKLILQKNKVQAGILRVDDWVATDALGRKLPTYEECGPVKEDRFVGMFYFMTHISPGGKGPFDVTKIMKANPDNPQWGDGDHYWGEPENGYYLSNEKWMIRLHASELSDAGVDVIIFDVTNDRTFPGSLPSGLRGIQGNAGQGREDTRILPSWEVRFQ